MRRHLAIGLLLASLAVTAGCRSGGLGGPQRPTPASTPAAEVTPVRETVAVVDIPAVLRSHRRWPELEVLLKKVDALQLRLSNPPPPPAPPPADFRADLQAEADRLSASLRAELAALEEQARRRLEAFVTDLKAEQEGKLADRQRSLNVELQRSIDTRRDELQRELEKFEIATMAEYRIPLLNLRLKADVVGVTNEEDGKRISDEADRLLRERDAKIRTRAQALDKTLQEFQKARTTDAEGQLRTLIASLEEDANTRMTAKQSEARAELELEAKAREKTLNTAVDERRKLLLGGTEEQLRAAHEKYTRQLQAESVRLQAELRAVTEQRIRLEDSVLAEIKIEIATLAQERKIDVVLTRVVASVNAMDLTRAVIARLRRP